MTRDSCVRSDPSKPDFLFCAACFEPYLSAAETAFGLQGHCSNQTITGRWKRGELLKFKGRRPREGKIRGREGGELIAVQGRTGQIKV